MKHLPIKGRDNGYLFSLVTVICYFLFVPSWMRVEGKGAMLQVEQVKLNIFVSFFFFRFAMIDGLSITANMEVLL